MADLAQQKLTEASLLRGFCLLSMGGLLAVLVKEPVPNAVIFAVRHLSSNSNLQFLGAVLAAFKTK